MELKIKYFSELSAAELYEIVRARQEIFLMEQNIVCRDFDGVDYDSLHCFLWDGGRVVAYLRAFLGEDDEIHIGRVLSLTHKIGLGKRLMQDALPKIYEEFGMKTILIHSQKHAEEFYLKLGFLTVSDVFLEEGVEHVTMLLHAPKNEDLSL